MRLTLRTLIAWLDDTLTPAEVKAIGHQVSESPYVKELIERIHRVTRQRRLTVPGETGADAVDPNMVAGYLDNQLNEEQVTELEKKCLTSDVNLAEVASVHQILSMIGHKAKVPADAKNRMYRLVRGREASTKPKPKPIRPAGEPRPEAPSHPAVKWTAPIQTKPKVIERFGPIAAVIALIGLLGYLAARTLPTNPDPVVATNPPAPVPVVEPTKPAPEIVPTPVVATTKPAEVDTEKSRAESARTDSLPRGEVGTIDAIEGVVLRSPMGAATWEAVEPKTPLPAQTRLINLAPFRNLVKTSAGEVTLVDSTEVIFSRPNRDEASDFELKRGQVLVQAVSGRPVPYNVRFEGHVLGVTPDPGHGVGIQRFHSFVNGTAEASPPRLRLLVPDGKATFKVGETDKTVTGPVTLTLQVSGQLADDSSSEMPGWVTGNQPSAFDKEIASQFGQYLRPGRPILADLVEAMDDPQPKVKEFAAKGLGTLGDMESVVMGLDRRDHLQFFRAVVDVLRENLAEGGESAKVVRDALVRQYDESGSKTAEPLIVGFPPSAASDENLLAGLVENLATNPNRGIRALTLDNLRTLTGRDSLEYDPDNPEGGKGLRAWQDLARRKELARPAPAASSR